MRKALFFLLTIILLSSCSSEVGEDLTPVPEKTQKVNFSVTGFSMETEPLADISSTKVEVKYDANMQYVIYNSDGSVRSNNKILATEGIKGISEELPYGNYTLAILVRPKTANNYDVYYPKNYATDTFGGNPWIAMGPDYRDMYFETLDFKVDATTSSTPMNIELKPMWTEIRINVENKETFVVPTGTVYIVCNVSPYNHAFLVKDKKFSNSMELGVSTVSKEYHYSLQRFRDVNYMSILTTEGDNLAVTLCFVRTEENLDDYNDYILEKKVIYKGDFKRGTIVTLTGKLQDDPKEPVGFTPSLTNLADGGTHPFPYPRQ